jgi:hypothetical protein
MKMSNFDKFPEPNTKQLKISAELRFFLEQIKIKQYRKLGEILNDLEKVKKVFRSWRRRSTGMFFHINIDFFLVKN